jgi:hypothetical protein
VVLIQTCQLVVQVLLDRVLLAEHRPEQQGLVAVAVLLLLVLMLQLVLAVRVGLVRLIA